MSDIHLRSFSSLIFRQLSVAAGEWVSVRADVFEGTASGAAWSVKHSVLLGKLWAASSCHSVGVQMMPASKRVSSFSPSLKELRGRKTTY